MRSMILAALAASVVGCLFLGTAAFVRARAKGRFYSFSLLCFSACIYSAFYTAEIMQPTLGGVLACIGIEYIGIASLTVSMFFVIRDFVGAEQASPWFVALVSLVPAVTAALALSTSRHELLYIEPYITRVSGLTILGFSKGPWYWVNIAYIYGVFGYGLVEFVRAIRAGNAGHRAQAIYMLGGFAAPIAANFIYLAGWTPAGADPAPLAFVVASAMCSAGFFRYRLFDIHPLARNLVFEYMRDAAIVVDEDGYVIDNNAAARALFPMLTGSTQATTIDALFAAYPEFRSATMTSASHPMLSFDQGSGDGHCLEIRRSRIRGRDGRTIGDVYTLIDVTEREQLQERLQELASLDGLTRVPNRRHFYELAAVELERARRHNRPIGFAVMDMNGFKDINDKYGHQAGDEALRLAARLCVDTLRSCDIVGRIGGDEFAFVFPECDDAGTAAAAEKIRLVVGSATCTIGVHLIPLSASIGSIGSAGPVHPDLEEILALADRRMYAEKARLAGAAPKVSAGAG